MHVLIAALPRSGSTMLAGLIHKPKRRLCLQEPGLGHPNKGLNRLNYQMRPWAKQFRSKHGAVKWIKAHIKSWSAKEVRRKSIEYMIRKHEPNKVILLVRDIRASAISYRERLLKVYDGRIIPEERFRLVTLPVANLLIRLSDLPNARIVRYENFCSDPKIRKRLEDWLGFPLDGNLKQGFQAEQWEDPAHSRMSEYKFHKGQITGRSIRHRAVYRNADEQAHAEFAQNLATKYQEFFGYS